MRTSPFGRLARPLWAAFLVGLAGASSGCVKRVAASSPPRASVKLLGATEERETKAIADFRVDVDAEGKEYEVPVKVVAFAETEPLSAEGYELRLSGDEAGRAGFEVDNFLLVEVLSPQGAVLNRVVVGYVDGVSVGRERLDNLGQRSFRFGPDEVALNRALPESGPFKLRVSALDIGGVGRVSEVWLRFVPRAGGGDDLRE